MGQEITDWTVAMLMGCFMVKNIDICRWQGGCVREMIGFRVVVSMSRRETVAVQQGMNGMQADDNPEQQGKENDFLCPVRENSLRT